MKQEDEMMILSIQIVGLFIGIWFTFVNVGKIVRGQSISGPNMVVMSAGWTAFVTATWLV